VSIDLLVDPSDVFGDNVSFQYTRMPLAGVFASVITGGLDTVREVDVEINPDGTPKDPEVFKAEMLYKFGFAVNDEDYDTTAPVSGKITIKAKVNNLAFTGEFTVTVAASLSTRLPKKVLGGFTTANSTPYAA
jgi:hypothetical protein